MEGRRERGRDRDKEAKMLTVAEHRVHTDHSKDTHSLLSKICLSPAVFHSKSIYLKPRYPGIHYISFPFGIVTAT